MVAVQESNGGRGILSVWKGNGKWRVAVGDLREGWRCSRVLEERLRALRCGSLGRVRDFSANAS